ncbi:integrase core domain-containing protein [Actinosynnema sp. NPDC053489]|uniref:integrase core domain-containing protein n=1 Tax=Actinosynnema sp. NPDC053489 TaxID=3363916 RepID=UPI0037C85163
MPAVQPHPRLPGGLIRPPSDGSTTAHRPTTPPACSRPSPRTACAAEEGRPRGARRTGPPTRRCRTNTDSRTSHSPSTASAPGREEVDPPEPDRVPTDRRHHRGDDRTRFLVGDQAGQFTASFDAVLAEAGSQVVEIPPRCQRANRYAERFVGTIRPEVADRPLIINEHPLRTVPTRYAAYDNHRRPHQALKLPPRPDQPIAKPGYTSIRHRPALGGLINEYEPTAAQPRVKPCGRLRRHTRLE